MTLEELQKKIEKIISYKTWNVRKKVDAMFEIDCNIYANMGLDSTKDEKILAKKQSLLIYRSIKKIDWYTGSAMLHSLNKSK